MVNRKAISAWRTLAAMLVISLVSGIGAAKAQTLQGAATAPNFNSVAQGEALQGNDAAYTVDEIVGAGHQFFGTTSSALASMVERIVGQYGLPNGYVIGQEAAGAFVGGLRYGEGMLYTKLEPIQPIFWQGPSIGWDFGGDGNRTMMLVYDLPQTSAIYRRFAGVNGSAYLVGGLGMTVLANTSNQRTIFVVPIQTGVGARLGLNVGYLKFTQSPTWNPF